MPNSSNTPNSRVLPSGQRQLLVGLASALFLMGLDTGIINVILPELQTVLHTSVSRIMMLATVYMTVMAAFQLLFGRLADLIDPVIVFLGGVACFFLGSLGCALSQDISHLLVGRGFQGLGGAMLGASFGAIVLRMIPRERTGATIGVMSMVLSLGSILGPPLGGLVAEHLSWPWVFVLNLPICLLAALPLTMRLWNSRQQPRLRSPLTLDSLDLFGAVYSICMFAALPFAFAQAAKHGWASSSSWIWLVVFAVSTMLFTHRQRRAKIPLIRLGVLTDPRVTTMIGVKCLLFMAVNAVMLVYPFFIVQRLALSTAQTGLLMLACAVSMAVLTPVSGRMTDRFGSRPVMLVGAGGLLVVAVLTSFLSVSAGRMTTFFSLAAFGACFACLTISSTVHLLRLAPKGEEGIFSALNSVLMPVGSSLGLAVFSYIHATAAAARNTTVEGALAGFQTSIVAVSGLAILLLALLQLGRFPKRGLP